MRWAAGGIAPRATSSAQNVLSCTCTGEVCAASGSAKEPDSAMAAASSKGRSGLNMATHLMAGVHFDQRGGGAAVKAEHFGP